MTQHPENKHQQRAGLKAAEEALACKVTSAGEYRQPTNYKTVSTCIIKMI